MNREMLKKYADFAVKSGINLQKGQVLIIDAPVEGAQFARECARAAFEAGAKDVSIHYADELLTRLRFERAEQGVLTDIKPSYAASYADYIENDDPESVALLRIISPDPEIFKGLPADKVAAADKAQRAALKPFKSFVTAKSQWSIAAIPSTPWAEKVFPGKKGDEAVEALWNAIFKVTRMDAADPVAAWRAHSDDNMARRDKLDAMALCRLHMTAGNGTDLTVELPDGACWGGALERTAGGVPYIPNVPTEELFTAPHRAGVNGVVYGTKPYVYNGDIIDGFCLWFEDGVVVKHTAKVGDDLLERLIRTDAHSCRLGEFALVPATSPINTSGLLFYNTLFDENAACHIALGSGYSSCIPGGPDMTPAQLEAAGVNQSLMHADVMVGAADTEIVGYDKAGKAYRLFEKGVWAI